VVAIEQSALLAAERKVRETTYLGVRMLVSALWVVAGLTAVGGSLTTFVGVRALAAPHGTFAALVAAVFAGAVAASPFLVAIAILHLLMDIADAPSREERQGSSRES
jgi:hypothetical protein